MTAPVYPSTGTSTGPGTGSSVQHGSDNLHVQRPVISRSSSETKNGTKTTEFWLTIAAVAGVLFAAYADGDVLTRNDGWRYAIIAVAAYVVSRGLAKLGSPERGGDRSNH